MNNDLINILACPECKHALVYDKYLVCTNCNTKYRIEDGIPIMVNEQKVSEKDDLDGSKISIE